MENKETNEKPQEKKLELSLPVTFEELEEKVAPGFRLNHNETLVRD